MRMSYRHAWLLVQDMNEGAGEPIVTAATGGKRGGGAMLTARGRWAVDTFRDLREQVQRTAASVAPRLTSDSAERSVHVAAAVSLEEVVEQLLADYALWAPGVLVRTVFGASDELADLILAGAAADVFISADLAQIDRLAAARLVRPEKRSLIAENRLAVIAPKEHGPRRPEGKGLARAKRRPNRSGGAGLPLGRLHAKLLGKPGAIRQAFAEGDSGEQFTKRRSSGACGPGQRGLRLRQRRGAGTRLPAAVPRRREAPSIRYAAAVVCRGEQREAASQLVKFLTSRQAAIRFRSCGFLPPPARAARVSELELRGPNYVLFPPRLMAPLFLTLTFLSPIAFDRSRLWHRRPADGRCRR